MQLVLASASPRRKEILEKNGYSFIIEKSNYKENTYKSNPIKTATENAFGKAKEIFDRLNNENLVVLGADTIVVLDNTIIGKPKDSLDAFSTLKKLSDNTHEVITGYAIVTKNKNIVDYDTSLVTFPPLSDELIIDYVKTGFPLDKAGSYGLQDGFIKVKSFTGSYNNIIGLPLEKIKQLLDDLLK